MEEEDLTGKLKTMLYLNGVSVSFDGFKALNNLSIIVHPNEMLAIIGPNGAGKTTMMDIITGKTRPDDGEVYFDGRTDLTKMDEEAKQIALDAVKFANESPDTPVEEMYTDVYSQPYLPYKTGKLPDLMNEDQH